MSARRAQSLRISILNSSCPVANFCLHRHVCQELMSRRSAGQPKFNSDSTENAAS